MCSPGSTAASACMAALRHKEATGQGQQIDIGMLDTHVAWLANQGMNYLATGREPEARLGNDHPNIVPYQVFPSAGRLHRAVDRQRPDLRPLLPRISASRHLLAGRPLRHQRRPRRPTAKLVTDTLTPVMQQGHPTDWWVDKLEAAEDRLRPDQYAGKGLRRPAGAGARRGGRDAARGVAGRRQGDRQSRCGCRKRPADYRLPPPVLGEHTDEVLGEPARPLGRQASGGAAGCKA